MFMSIVPFEVMVCGEFIILQKGGQCSFYL